MLAGTRQRLAHLAGVVRRDAVEEVHRDDEGQPRRLEVVDRREAVLDPAGVDEDDATDRPLHELVPEEPEPVLTGRAEEVQHHVGADRDAPEVHRDGRPVLVGHRTGVVDPEALDGHLRLGSQRLDLGDRTDERRLADGEPAGDDDLHRHRYRRLVVDAPRRVAVKVRGCHRGASSGG